MKKPAVIVTIILVACLAIGAAVVFLPSADTYQSTNTANDQSGASSQASQSPASSNSTIGGEGQYIDYSSDVIASTSGTKVLFFHAPWCPQCRALDASIKAGTIPASVTIIKVDYDTNQALRKKYGVTTQTTLVRVDDNGELVKKFVAYDSPTLASVIQNAL